jgi:hypothetical protein
MLIDKTNINKYLIPIISWISLLTFLLFAVECYIGNIKYMIFFGVLAIIIELDQIYLKLIQITENKTC